MINKTIWSTTPSDPVSGDPFNKANATQQGQRDNTANATQQGQRDNAANTANT